MTSIPLSILELAVVSQGENAADAIERSVKIARLVEKLGYKRVWLAEHHNMEHIAIRVASGGIMLPNHAPLVIAEQFGTLETLYPGRIDLGLGRAPGTDQLTAMALRRNNMATAYDFPEDIKSLQTFFSASNRNSKVRAFPGEGLDIPIWILGSSTDSAYLAAKMGLPYAFAAHFAPAQFRTAIEIYRSNFQPSAQLDKPYVLACVNIFGAETDDEAEFLVTSLYRMFLGIVTNERVPLQPPGNLPSTFYLPEVQDMLQRMTACTFTGSEDSLRKKLSVFIAETGVDELMAVSYIYDMDKRLRSYEILKESMIV